jgi:hypothetical protein
MPAIGGAKTAKKSMSANHAMSYQLNGGWSGGEMKQWRKRASRHDRGRGNNIKS